MYQRNHENRYPYYFLFLYALTYACNAIYGNFMPVYLHHIGYKQTLVGLLLALGPFIAIAAQPIWGIAGDRAKAKNTILKILLLGSGAAVSLYQISTGFYFLLVIMGVFSFFQTSINPMSDAITLEYLEKKPWKFGPIRMVGAIGYAVMAVLAGVLAKQNINSIFYLYPAVAIMAFFTVLPLPRIKGHQSEGNKVSPLKLFADGQLVILMAFNFIIQITVGFYHSFFAIYYTDMGADNGLVGWAMFISAISEVPFLLFADRILGKLGIRRTLIISSVVTGTRWILLYLIHNPYGILPFQLLHGFVFIVFTYSLATYINKEVPKELKASGQTINGLIGLGVARITGNLLGGFLSDLTSIRQVFLYNAFLIFLSALVFRIIFVKKKKWIDMVQ